MKTYGIWTIVLALTLVPLTPGCSDDDDDAGDEGGGDSNDSGHASNAGNSSGNGSGSGTNDDDDDGDDDDWGDDDDDDGPGDGGPTGGDIGDECRSDDDCQSRACLFAPDAAFGFCSKVCDSWSDCPSFWECVEVGNATRTYCAPS